MDHIAFDSGTLTVCVQGDAKFLARVEGTGDTAECLTGDQFTTSSNWNWNLKNGATQVWGTSKLTLDGFDGGWFATFAFG